jgi:hypothetical protein
VRDGFSWGAFIFGLIWMLYYRLWLVAIAFVVLGTALFFAFSAAHVPSAAVVTVWILIKLLLGFEASTLRRWTLQRRRWRDMGTVVADGRDTAERRFFDQWIDTRTRELVSAPMRGVPPAAATPVPSYDGPGVIGLFPRPGGQG